MEDRRKCTSLLYGSTESYDLKCRDGCDLDMDCVDCPGFEFAVQRLGAYEATGLSPEEITLLRVIELIDGPIAIVRCLDREEGCTLNNDKTACIYHYIFNSISADVAKRLSGITIADAMNKKI